MSNSVGLSTRFANSCASQKRNCCKAVYGIAGKARLCLLTGKHVSNKKCCRPQKRTKKCCC